MDRNWLGWNLDCACDKTYLLAFEFSKKTEPESRSLSDFRPTLKQPLFWERLGTALTVSNTVRISDPASYRNIIKNKRRHVAGKKKRKHI